MCNRYRPASVIRIRDVFGFTYTESGPPLEERYKTGGIGPLQPGPFVHRNGLGVGQWGLTPDGSATLRPTNKKSGRPMSTNNARWGAGQPEAWTFKGPWRRGQRCLVPVEDFDEPYWGHGGSRCIWWRFRRADGQPLMLAGLWNEWTDASTGEMIPSYTMLTTNCNAHPLLSLMHRHDVDAAGRPLPHEQQDKRTVVPLERSDWEKWLHGAPSDAAQLLRVPAPDLYAHGAVDPAQQVELATTPSLF